MADTFVHVYVKKIEMNTKWRKKDNSISKDLEIVIDSHEHGLLTSKLYRNIQSEIKFLGTGKKWIKVTAEVILESNSKDTRHLVLGVVIDDLSSRETTCTICVNEMITL